MVFRRINDTTINCIITEEDLNEHGIHLDDLFERKKEAVEFIRGVLAEASRTENFNIQSEYTSMKIAVLPDHTISLTISEDPAQSKMIRDAKGLIGQDDPEEAGNGTEEAMQMPESFLYLFPSMERVIRCARSVLTATEADTALYRTPAGEYFLTVYRNAASGSGFDQMVLGINEFGRLLATEPARIAGLIEHSDCIIPERAALQLLAL